MKFLNLLWAVSIAAFIGGATSKAQIPPAEQLLPDDTIAVLTIPDWQKFSTNYHQSAWGQLWNDPAMKAFRENFSSNFQADFLKPLEMELGIKFSEYQELLQGQITLALTPPSNVETDFVDFLLLIDSMGKSETLTAKLNELKKKWTEANKEVRTEKIRDVEFNSISFTGKDISELMKKAFPKPAEEAEEEEEEEAPESNQKVALRIGQYKSLLIIGENSKAIEKVLARQGGGLVPPLAEKAAYQKTHAQLFRDSIAHGWVNVKPIVEKILEAARKQEQPQQPGMPSLSVDKILPVLGITSLETVGAKIASGPEGSTFELLVGAPEAQREGVLKMLTLEKKDASPPPFVPADVIKFQRTRIDAQKAWTTLENMINRIDPTIAGLVQMMLTTAGKDKDPNFDLKKDLIGNLGDDFIQYEKAPKSTKVEDLQQSPTLTLIGSPNPARLLDALRMITSLLPPPLSTAPLQEREYLGKKIYSLSMAAMPQAGAEGDENAENQDEAGVKTQKFSFTSSGGYLAFSTDDAMLENFLRSGENPPKPLRAAPGFAEAAQKAGGMDNGFFTYENQAESIRFTMELMKSNPEAFHRVVFLSARSGENAEGIGRLFNLELLPGFDRIAKYFGIAVASATTTPDGFVMKAVAPKPAGLK